MAAKGVMYKEVAMQIILLTQYPSMGYYKVNYMKKANLMKIRDAKLRVYSIYTMIVGLP